VGTVTEIHDYLRVLFARVGHLSCPKCGRDVKPQSSQQIVAELAGLKEGKKFLVLAPLIDGRKGEHHDVIETIRRSGFTRARVDGAVVGLEDDIRLDKKRKHSIEAVVDRLIAKPDIDRTRLADSVEQSLKLGKGVVIVAVEGEPDRVMSQQRACANCNLSFPEPTPQLFSFNSPVGMCPDCSGLGTRMEMDADRLIPNPDLSINEGAVKAWGKLDEATSWGSDIVRALSKERGIDLDKPWKSMPQAHKDVLLFGTGGERVAIKFKGSWGGGTFRMRYEGLLQLDAAAHEGDAVRGHAPVLPALPLAASLLHLRTASACAARPSR
jgi:excinuclease ABC subunit A